MDVIIGTTVVRIQEDFMIIKIFDWFGEQKISVKIIAMVLMILFLLSLVPLLAISFYNRPAADDYSFGILTVHTWRETNSVFQTILTAFSQVKKTYLDWQGTFSAIFLFALQPGVFGAQYYFIATFLLLGAFVIGTFYFLYIICNYYMKTDKSSWIILSVCVLTLSIQLVFSARESFYWFNGGIYYTFYYSISLILLGMLLKIEYTKKKSIFSFLVVGFLSLFIGGGNYTTALATVIVVCLLAIVFTYQKNPAKNIVWIAFFLLLIGLGISAVAPGNAIRAASPDIHPMSPPKAIFYSFYYAMEKMGEWTNLLLVTALIFVIPLFWKAAKKNKFSFRYPLLVLIVSFCVFASQMTPPLYAIGTIGAERQIDIYYYAFVLICFLDWFYCIGWICKRLEYKERLEPSYTIAFLFLILFLAFTGFISSNYKGMSSISAYRSIKSGKAQTYAEEMDQRLKLYHDPLLKDVVVEPISIIPGVLKPDSVQGDSSNWQNEAIADFYDKDSVSLSK